MKAFRAVLTQVFNSGSYAFTAYAFPTLAIAVIAIAFGFAVRVRERSRSVSRRFSYLALAIAAWFGSTSLVYCSAVAAPAEFWSRFAVAIAGLVPVAGYGFSRRLLRLQEREKAQGLLWLAAVSLGVAALVTPLAVKRVEEQFWGFHPRGGALAVASLAFIIVTLAVTLRLFVVELRNPHRERQRMRIELFLTAYSIASLAVADAIPMFGVPLYPFGFVAIAIAGGVAAHAAWRYRLSDQGPEFAARQILETMQGAVLVLDLGGRIRMVNRAAYETLGYAETELIGSDMAAIIASPLNVGTASDTLMRGGVVRDRAMIWKTRIGGHIEVAVSGSMLRDEDGIPIGIVYVALDISDRKRAEQIEYYAFHDALTGLPNRLLFRNRLTFEIETESVSDTRVAVLVLDLDGFKRVNETFGHSLGDQLLQNVAGRLRDAAGTRESIARLGGDEFAFLLRCRVPDEPARVAERVLAEVARPFTLEGHELFITGSIGIAIHPADGHDAESLIRNADRAMYVAKEAGRNNYQAGGSALSERSRQRLFLESDLRRALEQEHLTLHYQPIVKVRDGGIVALEALIRWNHPVSGLLLPNDFIPIAEEARLIGIIGEWVLRRACTDMKRWQGAGFPSVGVAVNLSAYQFQQGDLAASVIQALDQSKLDAPSLQLEITETAAMQNADTAVQVLRKLKNRGVHIAIDDFGTGYASLSYLKRFPIDGVKLDQSFVREMTSTAGDAAIVSAVITMARALDLNVVAEGVETERQLAVLSEMRCEEVQGFLISPPVPAEDVEALLRTPPKLNALDVTQTTRTRLKLIRDRQS